MVRDSGGLLTKTQNAVKYTKLLFSSPLRKTKKYLYHSIVRAARLARTPVTPDGIYLSAYLTANSTTI